MAGELSRTRGALGRGSGSAAPASDPVSLCEALDRLLHKGACVRGDLTLSVAGVDLVYVGLDVLVASVETAMRAAEARPPKENIE